MGRPFMPCDLCGSSEPLLLFESPRLDGPLVRCRACSLLYVGRRRVDYTFTGVDAARSAALADRVRQLDLVREEVERAEQLLRAGVERERLERLRAHLAGGRLLDVGCSTGAFLETARRCFDVTGIEIEPTAAALARSRGQRVVTGTLTDLRPPAGGFDAVTMFHVIEHLASPHADLERVSAMLRPGGVLMIETPTIDCLWFRVGARRWRQLLPEHYYFFSRATLSELLSRCGFELIHCAKVGRRVSLRFAADRFRRSGVPGAGALPRLVDALGVGDRSVYLNPGDIMTAVARRSGASRSSERAAA